MNTDERIQKLEQEVQNLKQGIYNFSDRQEWTKSLKTRGLALGDNRKLYLGDQNDDTIYHDGTDTVIDPTASLNVKGGIKTNGTAGVTTVFATNGIFTVTVTNGLITNVV